jgi:hypothetical protein
MTPNQILSKRLERIETIPNKFIDAVNASQPQLYAELMEILSMLNVSAGELVLDQANLLLVDELMNEYYLRLRNGKYGGQVAWLINEMQVQKGLIDEFTELSYNAIASAQSQAVFASSTLTASRSLLGDDFKTNFINVIRDQVNTAIEAQANFNEFRNGLLQMFTNGERDGQILNWVKQVTNDRFAGADRNYTFAIGNELGLEFVQYVGGLLQDSRDFCIERDKKYYHIKEVQKWGTTPKQWQGRYRNTTPDNITQWLGGYNCKHSIAFVSAINVPKVDIERNIANGNYKPSDRERELLGIN